MAASFRTSLASLTLASTALAALAPAPAALAQEDGPRYELHGGIGRSLFGNDLVDSSHYNLGLGVNITERWGIELMGTQFDTYHEEGFGLDTDGEQYRLDALYHLADRSARARPYLAFGAGHQTLDSLQFAPDGEEEDTLVNAGVGIKYKLAKHLSWRTDMRIMNSVDHEYTDMAFSTGVSFLFGYSGRPAPAPEPEPSAPKDGDKDGVTDDRDRCLNTPLGVSVDNRGCALDSDNDGVADHRDQCPGTAKEYRVDSTGCPIELTENVSIEMSVEFATNSAEVREAYMSEIQKVADFMRQFDQTRVTVEGHTDSSGASAYNLDLSERRAEAVRQVLIERFGLAPNRVEAVGFGEQQPVASNDTAAGRERNRRVVAEISADVTRTETRE